MLMAREQIAARVGLEGQSVDDDRLLRISLRRRRVRIAHDEDETLRVGRPLVVINAIGNVRHAHRLAAPAIEEPELRAVAALPRGEKRQPFPVRAPRGGALAFRRIRELDLLRAVPAHHPQSDVFRSRTVSTLVTVYATHLPSGERCGSCTSRRRSDVVRAERALRRLRGERRGEQQEREKTRERG